MRNHGRHAAALAILAGCVLLAASAGRAELPPGHTMDQKELCLGCHDLSAELGARVEHAPAQSGDCAACHNPHVSRFDALLRERPGVVCVGCHDDLRLALERPVVHAPVADGRCVACHLPHGSEHANLLVGPSEELCRSCHSGLTEWASRSVQHPPFAQGKCASCHDPHAAEFAGLASKAGGGACAGCHPVTASFTQKHSGYPVENAACRQCHDPHASARDGLFRSSLHAPFEDGECTTCHAAPGASDPFALVAGQAELCGDCHEEQVEASRTAPFPHVSAGGGRCTDCHNPHSGDGKSLLTRNMQALCLDCHNPGGAKSGEQGRFVTHGGQDCSACHAPHAGERPLMLKLDSIDLCGQCHEHEHGIRHPLGEETKDPRSGNPMTCLSCHGIHDAPHKMYLLGSPEKDLCLGCHKDIGGGRR